MTREKSEILAEIIEKLEDTLDLIDKINDSEAVEKLYCEVRDLRDEFEYRRNE